jgi:hypothetical protein
MQEPICTAHVFLRNAVGVERLGLVAAATQGTREDRLGFTSLFGLLLSQPSTGGKDEG